MCLCLCTYMYLCLSAVCIFYRVARMCRISCLIYICHFPQKTPVIICSCAERDLQLKGILCIFAILYYMYTHVCMSMPIYVPIFMRVPMCTCIWVNLNPKSWTSNLIISTGFRCWHLAAKLGQKPLFLPSNLNLKSSSPHFRPEILNPESKIPHSDSHILNPESKIPNLKTPNPKPHIRNPTL